MIRWYFLLIAILSFCCSQNKKSTTTETADSSKTNGAAEIKSVKVIGDKFLITSRSIGNIEIGQTMQELKRNYQGFDFLTVPAWDFCIDGGGDGVVISKDKERLLFVCPTYGTDSVCLIIALNPKYYTDDGLRPSASIGRLLKRYPNMTVNNNMMCPGEFFYDNARKITYEFNSSNSNTVGVYKEGEFTTSKFDTTRKVDRISISKYR